MKSLFCVPLIAFALIVPGVTASGQPREHITYHDIEAEEHVGEYATVVGTVSAIWYDHSAPILELETFRVVIGDKGFPYIKALLGHKIAVTGTILSDRGYIEMVLTSADQLILLDEQNDDQPPNDSDHE
jgi:hypothetical protein